MKSSVDGKTFKNKCASYDLENEYTFFAFTWLSFLSCCHFHILEVANEITLSKAKETNFKEHKFRYPRELYNRIYSCSGVYFVYGQTRKYRLADVVMIDWHIHLKYITSMKNLNRYLLY